ncbi:MAG TPA: amino acid ABC transporter permease [Candidatus Aquicultor sp.]
MSFLHDTAQWLDSIRIIHLFASPTIIGDVLPILLKGAWLTISYSLLGQLFGIPLGIVAAVMKISRFRTLRALSTVYTDFFRGTPLLVQILIAMYALPIAIPNLRLMIPNYDMVGGVAVLGVNSGAYVAEIFRAGIESIHKGQMEAARSLGFSYLGAMRYIILPQTFRRVLPPLTNEFIALLKDSSLLSVVALPELAQQARNVSAWKANQSPFFGAALIYLAMTLPLTRLVAYMERRLAVSD